LSLILAGLAICNAALGVLMPWYVVTHLGVGIETDAYVASTALPQIIFLVVSFSLPHVLVPLLATQDQKTFGRDAWGFFLGVTGIFTLLGVVLFLTAGLWVPKMVLGFSDYAKLLTIRLSRIQLLGMVGNASVVVLWSVYYARHRFIRVELSSLFSSVVAILYLIWFLPRQGIAAAAWATVLSLGLKLVLLLPILGRLQWPQWNSFAMKEARRRIKPFLFGQVYSRTEPLIDRPLVSMGIAGDLSLLYIAQQIYSAVTIVVTKAISTPTVPRLATAAKSGDMLSFRRIYHERLFWMAGICVLGCLVLLIFGEPVLRLMIGHGGITTENVHKIWLITLALLGVLVGGTAGQVTAIAFYAMGDTKTPTKLFILTYTIYLPIKVVTFLQYGLMGLAVATSVHLVLNFLLQFVVLERVTSPARAAAVKVH
jgi:peptidoglycan biosynthesis protein MviN/MurJ (putative lipid II flippase)